MNRRFGPKRVDAKCAGLNAHGIEGDVVASAVEEGIVDVVLVVLPDDVARSVDAMCDGGGGG
jgi:hypothetical protein